jgi:hypothetical protein
MTAELLDDPAPGRGPRAADVITAAQQMAVTVSVAG